MILFNVNINLNLVNIRKKILSEILKLLSDNFTTWELNYTLINKIIKFSSNFQLKLTYPINNNFRNTELNFIFKNKNIKKTNF